MLGSTRCLWCPMRIITDENCTAYRCPGHPERPERVEGTLKKLRAQTELSINWGKPGADGEAAILRAHSPQHVQRLDQPEDFDADTPALPQISRHARASVGAALEALKAARAGERVFSLMRP